MADLVVPAALRALRAVVRRGVQVVKERLPQGAQEVVVEPALARNPQRLNPLGRIRQNLGHQISNRSHIQSSETFTRYYTTASRGTKTYGSPVKSAVGRLTTTSPFSSTLRPKLCGAFPRSAGGYSLGGNGARYFSHTPTAPAEVIQQVSQAMRAFILSGKDIRYYQNRKYVKGQIRAHLASAATDKQAPGAYVDFRLMPTFTCMTSSQPLGTSSLDDTRGGFLDVLDLDFQRVIRDISVVFQDLRRLSSLGDLPISLVEPHTLRVHFRGCDAEMVTRLCDEVGVCRGVIHEDERFAFDKIMFGNDHRNVNWHDMLSSSGESEWSGSICSHPDINVDVHDILNEPMWESAMEDDYDEIEPGGETSSSEGYGTQREIAKSLEPASAPVVTDIESFLAECEACRNPWAVAGKA